MSIVIKNVGGWEYAYESYRVGKKVIQKYLGSVNQPSVKKMIQSVQKRNRVPKELYPLFWDTDPAELDVRTSSRYIMERLLELGNLSSVEWLRKIYPDRKIIETLITSRRISKKSKFFWKLLFREI